MGYFPDIALVEFHTKWICIKWGPGVPQWKPNTTELKQRRYVNMDTNDDNKLPNYQREVHSWKIVSNNQCHN